VLTGPDESDRRREAASETVRLRAEETEMQRLLRDGSLTLGDLAAWRAGWTPRIAAAELAARPVTLPDAVTGIAGPDAEKRWADASIATRRAALDTLMTVTILPVIHGGQPFDPDGVEIAWKGRSE
jgi:hypothetical protein